MHPTSTRRKVLSRAFQGKSVFGPVGRFRVVSTSNEGGTKSRHTSQNRPRLKSASNLLLLIRIPRLFVSRRLSISIASVRPPSKTHPGCSHHHHGPTAKRSQPHTLSCLPNHRMKVPNSRKQTQCPVRGLSRPPLASIHTSRSGH